MFFEPNQPQEIISRLRTSTDPSLNYSAHTSFKANHNVSTAQSGNGDGGAVDEWVGCQRIVIDSNCSTCFYRSEQAAVRSSVCCTRRVFVRKMGSTGHRVTNMCVSETNKTGDKTSDTGSGQASQHHATEVLRAWPPASQKTADMDKNKLSCSLYVTSPSLLRT